MPSGAMILTLDALIQRLPPDQQKDIETQAARLIEDEMTLRDLRKAHELPVKRRIQIRRKRTSPPERG